MSQGAEVKNWDAIYEQGRYVDEPPIPFVENIIDELGEEGKKLHGLYVGCGNGRNYVPLLENGLNIRGIDISSVGISQLIERAPDAAGRVRVARFEDLTMARVFDYLVAIQVFQHGDEVTATNNFSIAKDILKPGGKLFLRVNSTETDIKHEHKIVDKSEDGGFSVLYEEGPKAGTNIHFYSEAELLNLSKKNGFSILGGMTERIEPRHEHADGTWAQWESIWQKN